MAKQSKSEALEAWRDAEHRYRDVVEPYLGGGKSKAADLDKDGAVAVAKARAKADKRRDAYFHRCLD